MARPPQYAYADEEPPVTAAAVKATIKRLDDGGGAHLLACLCMYYEEHGAMFSPQIKRRRQRIALDGVEYWLVKVPKRN